MRRSRVFPSEIIALTLLVGMLLGNSSLRGEPPPAKPSEPTLPKPTGPGKAVAQVLEGADRVAFLKEHNEARKAVGLPPLEWSDELAEYSLEWLKHNEAEALELINAGKMPQLKHRPATGEFKQKHGENLAFWFSTGPVSTDARQAVTMWVDEKADFDKLNQVKPYVVGDERSNPDPNVKPPMIGHYTQIVWRDTKKVGGSKWVYKSKDRTIVIVGANYDPPGNFIGRKPY